MSRTLEVWAKLVVLVSRAVCDLQRTEGLEAGILLSFSPEEVRGGRNERGKCSEEGGRVAGRGVGSREAFIHVPAQGEGEAAQEARGPCVHL